MSTATYRPQRSFAECDRLLCQPGSIFEMEEKMLFGNKQLVWKHAPPTFRDFFSKVYARYATRVLVSEPVPEPAEYHARQYHTYGQMWAESVKLAAWLREQGVRSGSRVALGGGNSAAWINAFVAIHLLGAVPVLLNSTLQMDSQLHCLTLTKPEIVLVDDKLAETLAPHVNVLAEKKVGMIYCIHNIHHLNSTVRAHVRDLKNLNPSPRAIADVEQGVDFEVDPESDGMIMFTSGTTNLPKAVLITQRGCLSHVIAGSIPVARALLRMGAPLEEALAVHNPPEEQGVMLIPVPLFHVTGTLGWMARGFHLGMKMVFMRRWNVEHGVKLIVDEKIGVIGGVPAIATAVIQSGLLPSDHVFSGITYGGAPPPKRLANDIIKRWPTVIATHAYGMTETAGLHCALAGPDYVANPEAVGPAVPVSQQRIVDAKTGKEVPPNTMGMVQCRGPNIMKEYIDNPKATAEALTRDGWLTTGDLGLIDENGFLCIRDRAKDVIIRGGENIASAEVENAIHQDDRIAEAAAVPVPDDVLGERVGLGVSLAPGAKATPESIIAAAESRLRHPARPAIVVIFPQLPRNANGKIVKSEIKEIVVAEWKKQGGGKAKAKL